MQCNDPEHVQKDSYGQYLNLSTRFVPTMRLDHDHDRIEIDSSLGLLNTRRNETITHQILSDALYRLNAPICRTSPPGVFSSTELNIQQSALFHEPARLTKSCLAVKPIHLSLLVFVENALRGRTAM